MKSFSRIVATAAVVLSAFAHHLSAQPQKQSRPFDQIWQTVKDNFFDPGLRGVDWDAAREHYRKEATEADSTDAFARVVNQMLSELKTSHTHYYTPEEPEYYQIAAIFGASIGEKLKPFLPDGRTDYVGIGVATAFSGEKAFVRAVFDGSPAAIGGIKVGDEILDVDAKPFHPVRSFAGKRDQPVQIRMQRTANPESAQVLSVTPRLLDPTAMFLDAMKASVQMTENKRGKVGYIHVWSYAGEIYQEQLEDELNGRLRDAEALVLDLRDGWGGANANYLWPFVAPPVTITSIGRDGKRSEYRAAWTKPVCLLVNDGSKSGKEVLARYFRKARRGQIIGSRTAGAVMAGRPFVMADGSVLYLAVGDGLIDGERPEGNPVVPDVEVPFRPEYSEGNDPQRQRAIEEMIKAIPRGSRNGER